MLHRRMFELVGSLKETDKALKARESLVELEDAMSVVSGYLEIRDLLSQGWNVMGVNRLQTVISDLIAIRYTESSEKEGRNFSKLQMLLSVVFGAIAIPGFATGVVEPLWNWLNLWRPDNQYAGDLLFFLIALFVLGVPILFFILSRSFCAISARIVKNGEK